MTEARMLFVATCDLSAQVRGRAVPSSRAEEVMRSGTGWVPANLDLTADSGSIDDGVFGTHGDLRLAPDSATVCTLGDPGDESAMDVVLADQTQPDGTPWECCPRTFLKNADAALTALGLRCRASFEHEFVILNQMIRQPFSLQRLRRADPFGQQLVRRLDSAGFLPENWLAECGPGQFEITLCPVDVRTAADRAVLLREIVRDEARAHDLDVTFSPLVDPDEVGSGVHVHFSLENEDGDPVLYDPAGAGRLSDLGGAFAAGIVRHASALCALTAASPLSYARLSPGRWSAGGAYLGLQDREAMLRVCPTVGRTEDAGSQFNLEFRAADATANPWLVMGALIRAGLHGVQHGYEPLAPITEADVAGRAAASPLPSSFSAALDALEGDDVVRGWFSDDMFSTYVAVKRAEVARLGSLTLNEQCERSRHAY